MVGPQPALPLDSPRRRGFRAENAARIDAPTVESGGHSGALSRPRLAANRLGRFTPTISDDGVPQASVGNYDCIRRRLRLHRAPTRRVLHQRIVDAILVAIAHVITNERAKVLFVQRDHMVEDLAATTAHPAFGNPVLPRCPNARSFWFQTSRRQESDDVGVKLWVAVENDVPIQGSFWKRFARSLRARSRSSKRICAKPSKWIA